MKITAFIIIALLATPLGTAAAAAPTGYAPFTGSWTCWSARNSTVASRFSLSDQGDWLVLHTAWNNPAGDTGYWNHYYRRNAADGTWTTLGYGSNGWTFQGRSDGWKDNTLTFTGTQQTQSGNVKMRQTFQLRTDGSFDHRWQAWDGKAWTTTSDSHCITP